MNKMMIGILIYTLTGTAVYAADMVINLQLRLKSPAGTYPTETGLSTKLQVLSAAGCVLREESFTGQSVSEGHLSLALGAGVRGGVDPNLSLNQVFDNSSAKNSLSCVDAAGNIVSSGQAYVPSSADNRLIRFSSVVSGETIIVDFPMNATAYAIQAESVGGKHGADLLTQNPATQLNQANLESLFSGLPQLSNLQNVANGGAISNATNAVNATNATTAVSFSGALGGDVSGTQSSVSVNRLKGVAVSATAPIMGQVLQFDGAEYVPVAIPSAPVTTVAGRTGNIILSSSDISGLDSMLNSGSVASGDVSGVFSALVVNNVGGATAAGVAAAVSDVATATNANTASKIVKRDGSGNIAVNAVSANNNSTQNLFVYEPTNTNRVQISAAASFSNYTLTLPTTAGSSGQVLTTNGAGVLSWSANGSGAGVTNVSSANSYLSVANGTSTPSLTLNVGTSTNTVAAGNDSRITGALQSSAFNAAVASAGCTTTQSLYWNSVSSSFQCQTIGTVANATTAINATNAVNFSGSVSGDVSGTQGALTVNRIKGIAVSPTAPTNGQVLQYNGSQYVPVAIPSAPVTTVAGRTGNVILSSSDISGLGSMLDGSSSAGGDVSGTFSALTVNTVGGASSSAVASAVSDVATATNANTASKIVKRDASGNISVTGVSSTNDSTQNLALYEATNTNRVLVKAPTTFSNYTLTLPTTAGSSGQVLTTNGSGVLSWIANGSGGTVSSITAGTGLSGGTITSTGTINLANTAVTAGTYGSATQTSQLTVDAQGRLTSASNVALALPPSQLTQAAATSGQVLKWNGSAWAPAADVNSGGTLTSVSSANAYLSVANPSTTPSLTLNVGTAANTVAAGDDSRITGALQSAFFNAAVASAGCTSTQTLYWNSVSSQFQCQTIGTVANATNAVTAVNFTGAVSGDVSGTQSALSVDRFKGVPVSATAPTAGQALVYNGTSWAPAAGVPKFVKISSDQTVSSTALANATGLSFTVVAGVTYKYKFNILYTTAATTTGLRIGITYPAATMSSALANIPGSATDGTGFLFSGFISTSGDSVVSANSPAVSPTVMMANIEGIFIPSAAGSVQLRVASEIGGSNIVVKAGSFIEILEVP